MFRAALEGHEARGLGFGPGGPLKVRHGGASLGQRARLVQDDGIYAAGRLERFGVLDQDARPGPAPDARHDGRRGSQPQGAGAGDDQHGDQRQHAVCKSLCRVEKEPRPEREQGHGDDRRHEDRGDAVCQPLHGGPAALRILHQADDLCQHRVFADLFGTVAQRPALIDRTGEHAAAGLLAHRQRLAAQHALIDVGGAIGHRAVHGDAPSRPHGDQVARLHPADRGRVLGTRLIDEQHRIGPQSGELPDRLHRAALSPLLEQPPEQHEGDHDARSLEVDVWLDAARGPECGVEEVEEAESVGDARAQRHERVHVGRAVAQLAPGSGEEAAPEDEDQRCGEQPRYPGRPRAVHEEHSDDEQRHGQSEGCRRAVLERAVVHRVFAFGLLGALLQVGDQSVSGSGDRLCQQFGRGPVGIVLHGNRCRREIYCRLPDALLGAERLADPCGAGGAAHARHREDAFGHHLFSV